MFSGIIEELGTVKYLDRTGPIAKLKVCAPRIASDLQHGQSVCVNGSCLTVVEKEMDLLNFEVMTETLRRTNLGFLKQQDKVNLERALKADGRIDGHFLTGHIDGTGIIKKREIKGGDTMITIDAPAQILRWIVLKGSLALDGVSLTVSGVEEESFCVNLIPYTLTNTTLGLKKVEDSVNIEADILAKYADRLLSLKRQTPASKITSSFLKTHGFA